VESVFQKQPMMRKVIYSLIPIYLFTFYLYGLQLAFLSVIVFAGGILTEFIMEKMRGKKISEACIVTCMLYALSLPPRVNWWIALIGIVFGILIGKEVFGGFARNPFNPAIAGRLFIYISFPNIMTYGWSGIGKFGFGVDAVSAATPLGLLRSGESLNLLDLLLGFKTGSMGETSIVLILLAALYLIFTKTASYQIILSTLLSGTTLAFLFKFLGFQNALDPVSSILSGSFLFVTVFMATDPISAPKKIPSKWIYGILIGSTTMVVRTFSLFPEGTSFGVLFGNTFASLLDEIFQNKGKK